MDSFLKEDTRGKVGKSLWRREWQSIPVFLPGESHERRSLAGYGPWGCKESDMTEQLYFHFTFSGSRGKESACNAGDQGSVPRLERSLEKGMGTHSSVLVAQSCLTLCDPMDCSPPGSSAPGILQARILERVAIPFSKGIFLTQESNLGVLNFRQILYH